MYKDVCYEGYAFQNKLFQGNFEISDYYVIFKIQGESYFSLRKLTDISSNLHFFSMEKIENKIDDLIFTEMNPINFDHKDRWIC